MYALYVCMYTHNPPTSVFAHYYTATNYCEFYLNSLTFSIKTLTMVINRSLPSAYCIAHVIHVCYLRYHFSNYIHKISVKHPRNWKVSSTLRIKYVISLFPIWLAANNTNRTNKFQYSYLIYFILLHGNQYYVKTWSLVTFFRA